MNCIMYATLTFYPISKNLIILSKQYYNSIIDGNQLCFTLFCNTFSIYHIF